MDLRYTFNEDVKNYDSIRPRYPAKMFEDIFKYSRISPDSNVLEIGIGTGQATKLFLDKGCKLTAVELGENLADYCKVKFENYKNISIINDDFLKCDLPENSFDLIYSATAFHWIPQPSGYEKVKRLLSKNGILALFWNHPFVSRCDDKTNVASMAVYKKYRPSDKKQVEFCEDDYKIKLRELKDNNFDAVFSDVYKRVRRLSSDEYIDLLNTYSDHRALSKDIKQSFEENMKNSLDAVGGYINIYDTIDLYLLK